MGILFTILMGILFTITMGILFTIVLGIQFTISNLLILDELGFKRLLGYSADDFFEIISKRYEKGSVIITTNKTFEQWGDIFTDNILASVILDRVVHYSTIIKINGPSYRAKDLKKGGDKL